MVWFIAAAALIIIQAQLEALPVHRAALIHAHVHAKHMTYLTVVRCLAGYDNYGYDTYGYDRYGYNKDGESPGPSPSGVFRAAGL